MQNDKKLCEICSSERRVFLSGETQQYLCDIHRQEVIKWGKVLTRRKLTDPNQIILCDTYAELVLYNIDYKERARCKISLDKVDKVKNHKWAYHSAGYVSTNVGDKILLLHRYLVDCPDDMEVDHINRIKLDFRNENLRICNSSENGVNRKIGSDNTSGVTGISYDKSRSKWQSGLLFQRKQVFQKRFDNFDDAVHARLRAEMQHFKDYSPNYNHDTNTIQLQYLSHDDNKQTYIEVDKDGKVIEFKKLPR